MPDPRRNVLAGDATGAVRPGYDHDWFPWNPLPAGTPVSWRDGNRTAVSVVIHLGAVEWEDRDSAPPRPPGGRGVGQPPDVPRMSHREFGHRVGIFRLLRLLDAVGVKPAAIVDVLTAERYRPLIDRLVPAASEILAGGLSASRPITSRMTEDEERDYIDVTMARLAQALGERPAGWLGPEHNESARTPALLAAVGLRHLADWGNDELPYPVPGAGADLWAFPLSWELSDLAAGWLRMVAPDTWADSVIEAFDVLHAEGGRMLALHLHPWLSGQAFRAAAVERVLRHISEARNVWLAAPVEIVEHCRSEQAP